MTAPAIAPTVNTYTASTPYLTVSEWLNAPTAVEIDDLVPGGDQATQQQALADCILRASSWIDERVKQVLAATVNVDPARRCLVREGVVRVPLKYKPVLQVNAVSVGRTQTMLAPLDDLTGVGFEDGGVIVVPVCGYRDGERPIVQVTYVNGYPNTLTTAAAAAGGSALPVADATGVYPGTMLTISDGKVTEQVTVAATYTAGTSLPLTAPLANAHAIGAAVTNLPPRVKQAAILLTSALVQTRGNDAIILAMLNDPSQIAATDKTVGSNVQLALGILASLRRVW